MGLEVRLRGGFGRRDFFFKGDAFDYVSIKTIGASIVQTGF
jgi:hypothetical protein